MISRVIFLLVPCFLSLVPVVSGMGVMEHREELGTLKEQSQEQDQISQLAKQQQESFDKIEAAMTAKQIKTGTLSKEIRSKYGEPTSVSPQAEGQKWLYRSLKGKFLDRPWIFLYFDGKGVLSGWDCGHIGLREDK